MSKDKQYTKLNPKTVLRGIIEHKPKYKIAEEAGSEAKGIHSKINSVNKHMETDEFKQVAQNFARGLEEEIQRLLNSIKERQHDSTEYKDMVSSIEKLVKLKELITGNATDRQEIDLSEELKDFMGNA